MLGMNAWRGNGAYARSSEVVQPEAGPGRRLSRGVATLAMTAVLALIAALMVSLPAPAAAVSVQEQGASTAVTSDPLPTAQIDGIVWEQAASATTVYAGGAF